MQKIFARLTKEAEQDLEDISKYTLNTWGPQKLAQYVGGLGRVLNLISTGKVEKALYKHQYSSTRLYMKQYEFHYIFYIDDQKDPSNGPIIIAILHSIMDLPTHLDERMSD